MIRLLPLLIFTLALGASPLAADTVKGVPLDNVCAEGFSGDYAAAKELSKSGALAKDGKKKGFSIVGLDGQTIKLDANGAGLLLRVLQYSKKTEQVEVEAEGKLRGAQLAVDQIRLS